MGVNGIYGLSGSGMDIESMVKVGMMSRQNEYDKMAQKFTKNEWLKADYLELSNKITTFNSSTLSQYKMSNTMNAKSAESSSSAVKVTASSNATLMNHKVSVESLSSNAYLISTNESIKRYGSDEHSIQLKDILYQRLNKNSDGTYNLRVMQTDEATADAARSTSEMASGDIAFKFTISDGVTKEKDASGNVIQETVNGVKQDKIKKVDISFTYEDIANGATLNDLVSKINSAGLNIKATYDSVRDRFSFYNSQGGEDNKISISVPDDGWNSAHTKMNVIGTVTAKFFNSLQLYQSKDGELYSTEAETDGSYATKDSGGASMKFTAGTTSELAGENGQITVDGVKYSTTNNTAVVGGLTYTALNTLDKTQAATVSVTQDTDAIIDKVKSFITDYNTLLADLYKKYDEKPNNDYKPLTQTQKDQMKDDQITKWEEKAKTGLLYHDQTLGKVIMNMRNAIAEKVDGIDSNYNSMFSLGVSTTGIKGQLVLDEDKLKKALAEDPDAVYNVFATLDSKNLNDSAKSGVAQRLGDIFVDATKSIKNRAGSSADITEDSDLNNLLRNLQTKMSNFKRLMTSFENALYKKYDAMESTLAKIGTQLNYIMGSSGQ